MQGELINQKSYFRLLGYIANKVPEVKGIHSIPNSGRRTKWEAQALVTSGLKKGVWDIFVPVARLGFHGMYIEFKYADGKLTKEQIWFCNYATKQGFHMKIFRDSFEAFRYTINYITGREPEQYGVKIQ